MGLKTNSHRKISNLNTNINTQQTTIQIFDNKAHNYINMETSSSLFQQQDLNGYGNNTPKPSHPPPIRITQTTFGTYVIRLYENC